MEARRGVRAFQGVAHVHENGFVHSDIKFGNVILEEVAHGRCSANLSDFGLAYGDVVCLCVHLPIFPARRSRSDNSETSTEGYCYHGSMRRRRRGGRLTVC